MYEKLFHPSNKGKLVGEHGVNDRVGKLVSKQPTYECTSNDLTLKRLKNHFNSFSISV